MTNGRPSITDALLEKRNVMAAVVLRDIKSRFFNHGIGFLLVPMWPLAHMLVLLILYTLVGRKAPYGDHLATFFATGLLPTLTFNYVSRFMGLSVMMNKSMLSFPVVSIIDIMTARAFLEVISSCITLFLTIVILYTYGSDPFPSNPYEACEAFLAVIILSIGVGSIVCVVSIILKPFITIYTLLTIIIYISSGTMFVISNLPNQVQYILSFNPVVHVVEWMRSAYYEGYGSIYLDKSYPIAFGVTCLLIGLLLERGLRRAILEG